MDGFALQKLFPCERLVQPHGQVLHHESVKYHRGPGVPLYEDRKASVGTEKVRQNKRWSSAAPWWKRQQQAVMLTAMLEA